ncbi:DNA-directed RNA polymerase subunit beta' [Mycoplasma nasistruthionis]|uniref:DNA-directed RNA polymerase subunit beta' n=1 Tax=Mycoplasma nasistruthionis TaxID=353852 RepID=A0A5B7XW42_9MOLU|nr:DNA-directed RNA polymerase subunit beta' [Mycoplasma nasistruthionis]QCZ36695.1 DNA-directed RNA polymerase subunit beta' [Mycoplasma nasistruthionis]
MSNFDTTIKNATKTINKITLSLATNEDVLAWSNGEVTKAETINYKTYKPEKDGLFDELIFGPTTDYKCPVCGTKYKKSDEGQHCSKTPACEKYKPEILPKITRRTRMGHIKLHNPVVHFWFFKIDHSIIAKLLGLKVDQSSKPVTKADLEKIIYYKSHIVLEDGGLKSLHKNRIIDINDAVEIYHNALTEMLEMHDENSDEYEDIKTSLEELDEYANSKIGKDFGIDFYQYNEIIHEYSDAKIDTGSKAIEYLLEKVDLQKELEEVKKEIDYINSIDTGSLIAKGSSREQERNKLYKRLNVINSFINSGQHPKQMLIYNLPVMPADLRPLIQLDGGRHSTSDVNELYRRIIIRNNRLGKWIESDAPMLIKQNEYRMIQEAVDALIDNGRKKPSPVTSKDNNPLKSISDALTGKKGRFRQNLLGKRVDYSGRSVIVVGPNLKMHEVGIPRDMAAKLFEPWIINELMNGEPNVTSVKSAKKMIENLNPIIWPYVEKAIEGRPVLLNRAPTLHRLSIQAFQPVLIRGKAIKLHPLVTTAFNADFDGDQMAVHVPVSPQAVREAQELMLASKNILGPKDGEPIINPSQDMILGLYYLTMEKDGSAKAEQNEGKYFADYNDMLKAYENNLVSLHTRVILPIETLEKESVSNNTKNAYIFSTVGKFILNKALPSDFEFIFGKYVGQNGEGKEKIHTSSDVNVLDLYTFGYGENGKKIVSEAPVNLALSKKDIAKIVRKIYETYVAVVTIEDVASVINTTTELNYETRFEACADLKDYAGNPINTSHAKLLSNLIKKEFEYLVYLHRKKNPDLNLAEAPRWTISTYTTVLQKVWFEYSNYVASILDNIKNLGFKFSTISGTTISMNDITTIDSTRAKIQEGDNYIKQLASYFKKGWITDDERYTLTINKWTSVKEEIEKDLKAETKKDIDNPLFMMFTSGARGNSSNFTQLAGMRGLMNNNTKVLKADAENDRVVRSTVEIPVKSSFLSGLTAYEFYSSTHGARKGLTDTALNTAKSGYLTRRLVDVAQGIVVREADCGSDFGFVVKDIKDTKTDTVIEPLAERIEGRFTNKAILDDNGNVLVAGNTLITPELAEKIVNEYGKSEVEIRSVLSCHTRNGVCKMCYGKDLATNRLVNIGEAVGVVAAQSIGEPGTQLTMRTFHTGGVAGGEDITGGFGRLTELIDAYDFPWGKPAVISSVNGTVVSIDTPELKTEGKVADSKVVRVEYRDKEGNTLYAEFPGKSSQKLRVKPGDKVVSGQKLFEGPIILNDLLKVADTRSVQNYLLKEIQRLYRLQGITISDKYIEIIIRQMLSKIIITDPGDSKFFTGSLVDTLVYQRVNGELLAQGKKPAYGEVKIRGAKQTPLLSDSFLSAASYQETAKILVNASIGQKVDLLEGLKENIILGHKIPAGTNGNYELKGKYDIRDPRSYFTDKADDTYNFDEQIHDELDMDEFEIAAEYDTEYEINSSDDFFELIEDQNSEFTDEDEMFEAIDDIDEGYMY